MTAIKQPRIEIIDGFTEKNGFIEPNYKEIPVVIKNFNLEQKWALVELKNGEIHQVKLNDVIDFPFYP